MQLAKLSGAANGNTRRLGLGFQLIFAVYSSCLLVFMYESRPPHVWDAPRRYLYFWRPRAVSLSERDFILFYAELFLIPAVVIFVCLRSSERLSLTTLLLRIGGSCGHCRSPARRLVRRRPSLIFRSS